MGNSIKTCSMSGSVSSNYVFFCFFCHKKVIISWPKKQRGKMNVMTKTNNDWNWTKNNLKTADKINTTVVTERQQRKTWLMGGSSSTHRDAAWQVQGCRFQSRLRKGCITCAQLGYTLFPQGQSNTPHPWNKHMNIHEWRVAVAQSQGWALAWPGEGSWCDKPVVQMCPQCFGPVRCRETDDSDTPD